MLPALGWHGVKLDIVHRRLQETERKVSALKNESRFGQVIRTDAISGELDEHMKNISHYMDYFSVDGESHALE